MKLLEGKTALITGAARGIGKEIANAFATHGANIAITDVAALENTQKVAKELEAHGIKAGAYQSDASSFEESEKLIEQVLEDFGSLEILVNNAGITRDNLLLRMTEDQWDDVLRINLKSVYNLTKHAIRPMMKAKLGSIINMSSVVGMMGNAGQANYSASKAGMIGFTKSIAQELGSRNIRCNAIAPGFIQTEMTEQLPEEAKTRFLAGIPLNRFADPGEVASVAVFLASDMSSYVSGQVISVCGALNT